MIKKNEKVIYLFIYMIMVILTAPVVFADADLDTNIKIDIFNPGKPGKSLKRNLQKNEKICKDENALNFSPTGSHKQKLCVYKNKESKVYVENVNIILDNIERIKKSFIKKKPPTINNQNVLIKDLEKEKENNKLEELECDDSNILTQNLKKGDFDNNFSFKKIEVTYEVKKLQNNLNRLGFDVGEVDGFFGIKTEESVKKLQKKYGLKPDGMVGKKTINVINNFCYKEDLGDNFKETIDEETPLTEKKPFVNEIKSLIKTSMEKVVKVIDWVISILTFTLFK